MRIEGRSSAARHAFVAGMLLGAILLFAMPTVAQAHQASDYCTSPWGVAELPNIHYRFTEGVPTNTFRGRVDDAANAWTNVGGVNLNYIRDNLSPANFNYDNCNDGLTNIATIHYKDLGGHDAYAATKRCVQANGTMRDFRTAFNRNLNWNITTSDPGPNEVDVQHVATHELGHGTGGWTFDSPLGHFNNSTLCPSSGSFTSWHTMCDAVINIRTGDDDYGKAFRRSLETHDMDTFENAYD